MANLFILIIQTINMLGHMCASVLGTSVPYKHVSLSVAKNQPVFITALCYILSLALCKATKRQFPLHIDINTLAYQYKA